MFRAFRRIRAKLTYANVMATVAVLLALTGSAYAAGLVGSAQIKNNSIRSVDVRNGTLTGNDIKSSSIDITDLKASTIVALTQIMFGSVSGTGTVDTARTLFVSQAMVTHPSTGVYCFNNLPWQPSGGTITTNYDSSITDPYEWQIDVTSQSGCVAGTDVKVTVFNDDDSDGIPVEVNAPFFFAFW